MSSSNQYLGRVYDIGAYINAARAVTSEVIANTPEADRTALPVHIEHLKCLTDAVQFLLDRAGEFVQELERDMEAVQ